MAETHMSALRFDNDRNIAAASVLGEALSEKQLAGAFKLSGAELKALLARAHELGCCREADGKWRFDMPREKIALRGLELSTMLRPLYCAVENTHMTEQLFSRYCERLAGTFGSSRGELAAFFGELGAAAEKERNTTLAAEIYENTVEVARQAEPEVKKDLFVRAVLNISRLEFMRGMSPTKTLSCQHEALQLVHQNNLTAADALLMLYAGMSEHFCGSMQEGYTLREKGIKYLKQFKDEAMPLIGWHYYLLGNFRRTIAYYEAFILAIESRKDSNIISFAYPPIIFSYIFLGEYHRALILAEIIYNKAMDARDHFAATLILSNIGRAYVYAEDFERAETVLYQALAEAKQEDYGWGLYYTLFGICGLQYVKGNFLACREALDLAIQAAHKHGFREINATPFVLDVLKMIDERGMEPVDGMSYRTELQSCVSSQNIHMAGVAFRHLALIRKSEGQNPEDVLRDLETSTKMLEESGNMRELAETYLACARLFYELENIDKAAKYAQSAWSVQGEVEHKNFPHEFIGLVRNKGYQLDLNVMLETAWIEYRHIIDPDRLIARMLSSMCRQMRVESAAFVIVRSGKVRPLLLQNIDREESSPQYQRMMAIATHAADNKKLFAVQDEKLALRHKLDLSTNPRFILCLPFINGESVAAAIYMESYYKEDTISAREAGLLTDFAGKLSEHLFSILDYGRLRAESGRVENGAQAAARINTDGARCESVDENIAIIQMQISKIAKTKIPVLITGETGVGKEIFCQQLYEQSNYKRAFVKVNCGAIPETLMESELFGYERGSFTGASQQKKGYFELAEGGTIFLDEIGELPLQMQVKLLRVLQEHEFIRVGGTRAVQVDFRLIAATNKDLSAEVEKGCFRKDLYYRLNVVQLYIPPLRERKADIANMANFFVAGFCRELGCPPCRISDAALVSMLDYDWPGNVRELENAMQRAVLLADNGVINTLPLGDGQHQGPQKEKLVTLEEMERKYILKVVSACGGKIAGPGGAAEVLGLKRSTLNSKMQKLWIKGGEHGEKASDG
jgi:formate hydrogenlyase transcriptional activator